MTTRRRLNFWEFTKESARHATAEFFGPLLDSRPEPRRSSYTNNTRHDLKSSVPHERIREREHVNAEQMGDLADQITEYVSRAQGSDRGRKMWEELFVEHGKTLVDEQSSRLAAALDAAHRAHEAAATTETPSTRKSAHEIPRTTDR